MKEQKIAPGKYGYFDAEKREYVIIRPDTPRPWYNYLMNETYVAMISNTGGGVSYDKDPGIYRLLRYRYQNIPYDRPGRYIYIKDRQSGKYWSGCWAPVLPPVEKCFYQCRVGFSYQVITFEYEGIRTEITYFVPQDKPLEIWDLTVTNLSSRKRKLSTFSYAEFAFWGAMRDLMNIDNCPNESKQKYSKGAIIHSSFNDIGTGLDNCIFVQNFGFHTSNQTPFGHNGDRDRFLGNYHDEKNPIVLEKGESTNYCKDGGYPIGCLEHRFELKPGQTKRIVYQTGMAKNEADVFRMSQKYKSTRQVDLALQEVKRFWSEKMDLFKVSTPDAEFDALVNGFVQYQAAMTMWLSRSISSYEWGMGRGMGFRDSCQDQLGMMHALPDRSRTMLLRLCSAIYPDGSAAHNSFPLRKQYDGAGFYDDHHWLAIPICQYVKETGDLKFLQQKVDYVTSGKKGTVLEHLLKCQEYAWTLRGKHGLMQVGHADWNDGLNPPDLTTESPFNSALYCFSTKLLVELLEALGKKNLAEKYQKRYDIQKKLMNKAAWDGQWYQRMIYTNGMILGSRKSKDGRIFLEPQPWAVLGGVAEGERAEVVLNAVEKYLGTPDGHKIMDRPFKSFDPEIGGTTTDPGGIKENGAVFNHASSWVINAEGFIGRGDKAMEYFKRMCGATKNRKAEVHESEPYVACQFISEKPFHIVGRGRNAWLTGTATWMAHGAKQYILGCRPEYKGLRIDPSIPSDWDGFKLSRVFRGTRYEISVKNPQHVSHGVKYLVVHGKIISGCIIPVQKGKRTVEVTAVMGR